MAKPGGGKAAPGMNVAELRQNLKFARTEPLQAAFAIDSHGQVVMQLHRHVPGRNLEKQIKDAAPDARNHRWGTVLIDRDDPKLVRFTVNKAGGSMARKLVIALKGTGFKKVKIQLDDGTELETDADEEEAPGGSPPSPQSTATMGATPPTAPDGGAPHTAAPDGGAAAGPPDKTAPEVRAPDAPAADAGTPQPPGEQTGQPDPQALVSELTGLVRQVARIIKQDPAMRASMTALATSAQLALKSGDHDAAKRAVDALRELVSRNAGPAQTPAPSQPRPEGKNGLDPAIVQKLQKSRATWDATLAKIARDMDGLVKAVGTASDGHELGATFERDFQKAVEPLLQTLDKSLSSLLHDALGAGDDPAQQRILEQARVKVTEYRKFVDKNPVIGHLDSNPFLAVKIGQTLDTTLTAMSRVLR